tara:strand:+ start:1000 stop:2046 length:1047 start_codon:yes stop_codon:yes gene_type:complete
MIPRASKYFTKLTSGALLLIVFTSLGGFGISFGIWVMNQPTGINIVRQVHIEKGMSANQVGKALERHGLIRSARGFSWIARLRGLSHKLEAGQYSLSGQMTTDEILTNLLKAPLHLNRVTIPEGLTLQETAALLHNQGVADSAQFAALSVDVATVKAQGIMSHTLEGYLFPETYFLDSDASEQEIMRRMVTEFFAVFDDTLMGRLDSLGMSLHEIVTLASIVETEAVVDHERPIIASIFHRRLNLNRRLESCATVEYAIGTHKTRLTHEDLRVRSPFNTYIHKGLPPGPIANPGRASLLATLYPDSTEYLYFVARGDGTHKFSRTNKEHEIAKRAIRHQMLQNNTTNN